MRNLIINKTKHYVLNYKGEELVKDENDLFTSEIAITYTKPIMFMGHISGARGSSQVEIFGTDISYDKIIILSKKTFDRLKIDENSVFFIDKQPAYDNEDTPLYDYRVKRIAETINEVAIAIEKVSK